MPPNTKFDEAGMHPMASMVMHGTPNGYSDSIPGLSAGLYFVLLIMKCPEIRKRYKGGGGREPTLLFVMGRGFECKRYGRFDHYYPMPDGFLTKFS